MRRQLLTCTALSFGVLWIIPGIAGAQTLGAEESALARTGLFARNRNISVRQRPRPEYAALGKRLGGFQLFPTLSTGGEISDNIFAVKSGTAGDVIFHARPGLALQSNWSRHALNAFIQADRREYASHGWESTTDWTVRVDGRLDVRRNTALAATVGYRRETEPRTSPNSPLNSRGPVQYNVASADLSGAQSFNRLRVSSHINLSDYAFDNARTVAGETILERDRNVTVFSQVARGEVSLSPSTSVFAAVAANQRAFRNQPSGASRDSHGVEAAIGANFDVSRLVRGELSVGYLSQTYQSPLYKDVSGPTVRGRIEYFPTQLTTVTAVASSSVIDSSIPGAGGYLSNNFIVQADHELLRNVILNAALTYGQDSYRGVDRNDERESASLGATYLLNRAAGLSLTYMHLEQQSSGADRGRNFAENRVRAGVTLQF